VLQQSEEIMKPILLLGVTPVLVARLLPASLALRVLVAAALMAAATCFGQPFGTWTMNPERSSFSGGVQPKSFIARIDAHPKGEVFTLDRTEPDGRTSSSSSMLYLDGTARAFHDFGCSGTQSSRRVDGISVEILRQCGAGAWTNSSGGPRQRTNSFWRFPNNALTVAALTTG